MLFVIFVVVLAIGIGLLVWYNTSYNGYGEWPGVVGGLITIVGTIAVVVSVVVMIVQYAGVNAKVEKNKEIYNSLTYQYENAVFANDDDAVGKKELYNQIQDWNADVKYYQSIQRDFWLGIYYPNIFDQFKLIEYDK